MGEHSFNICDDFDDKKKSFGAAMMIIVIFSVIFILIMGIRMLILRLQ